MKTTLHQLHAAKVSNNCPLCYSKEGLEFTFSQEEVENRFYSKAKKEIVEKLQCSNCQQQVYPVNWNEDIERVHEYHRKLVQQKSTSIKLKPLLYIIILTDALLIAALIYYFNR